MHEHIQCEHEIKYCKVCDVCYCEKCHKEWYSWKITYNQPPTTWIGDGTYPKITYKDGTVEYQTTDVIQTHVHGKDLE